MEKIIIGSDHAGVELKDFIKQSLLKEYDIEDIGTFSKDSCDYPDIAKKLANTMKTEKDCLGILICGTGIGMSIAVNRYDFIRGALLYNKDVAKLSKEHNNANVLAFGGRILDQNTIKNIIKTFFVSKFEGGRHEKRLKKLGECNAIC